MIKIRYLPIRQDDDIDYVFDGEIVIITQQGISKTISFTDLDENEYIYSQHPIQEAYRKDGVLYLSLLKPHKFPVPEWAKIEPQWIEINEGVD